MVSRCTFGVASSLPEIPRGRPTGLPFFLGEKPVPKMTTNIPNVTVNLKKLSKTIDDNLDFIVRDTSGEVYESLTAKPGGASDGTPRDTNRATVGWNLTEGGPNYSDPGEGPSNHGEPEGTKAAKAAVGKGALRASVANGVPYISVLDTGTSKQAPSGFVRRAVHKAVNWLAGYNVLDPNTRKSL